MARPRKDSGEPDAKLRLQEAFWVVLREKLYSHITVSDVTRAAGVNKNTLYYHYGCIEDLALEAIHGLLPVGIAEQVFMGVPPQNLLSKLDPERTAAYLDKVSLAAGPQGVGMLSQMMKEVLANFWLGKFGLTPEDLGAEEAMMIAFASSGVVGLLGSSFGGDRLRFLKFMGSPFANNAVKEALATLGRARARKYGEDCNFPVF